MERFYRVIAGLIALLAVSVIAAGVSPAGIRANAQQPDVFEIVVPGESLSVPLNPVATGFDTLGASLGVLSAFADGARCMTVDVVTTNDVTIQIGLAGQPDECSRDGAVVILVDGQNRQLAEGFTLVKGTRVTLSNLGPVAPDGGTPYIIGSGGQDSGGRPVEPNIVPPAAGDAGLATWQEIPVS